MGGSASSADFVFLGGDVSLDLVNTTIVLNGRFTDLLTTPQRLSEWIAAAGLAPSASARLGTDLHGRAIELREAIRSACTALIDGAAIPGEALDVLNEALRSVPVPELRQDDGALTLEPRVDLDRDPETLLGILAQHAAEVVSGDRADRLRRCDNHDTCTLLFMDTSRSRSRRWCSMELCGNRHKVAAHHARAVSNRIRR